jgi:hypothetical protein
MSLVRLDRAMFIRMAYCYTYGNFSRKTFTSSHTHTHAYMHTCIYVAINVVCMYFSGRPCSMWPTPNHKVHAFACAFVQVVKLALFLQFVTCGFLFYGCELVGHLDTGLYRPRTLVGA